MKKATSLLFIIVLIFSLCSCATEKKPEISNPDLTEPPTENITEENITKLPGEIEKIIPIKKNFKDSLTGVVNYMQYISENELLCIVWEKDQKDHIYVYNTETETMKDTGKTIDSVNNIKYYDDYLWTIKNIVMSPTITLKRYDENFDPVSETSFSDDAIRIMDYVVSDDGTKIMVTDTIDTENPTITAKIVDLETKKEIKLEYDRNEKYKAEGVYSLTDNTFIFRCDYKENGKKYSAFCLSDYDGKIVNTYLSENDRVVRNEYDDFILIYDQSVLVPTRPGDCLLIDKTTGETKTVKFSGPAGEGQDVYASPNGKYVMTKSEKDEYRYYRIYSTDSGKMIFEFDLNYDEYGSHYILIDDMNDLVNVIEYDLGTEEKNIQIYSLGEKQ